MKKRLIHWTPTILWATLIFFLSSIPSLKASDNPFIQNLINTLGHLTEYLVLYLLINRSLRKDNYTGNICKASAFASFWYAVLDELHQSFIPGRQMDAKDVLFDTLGIVVAICIQVIIKKNKANANKKGK